jgi:hypothetical protein
MCHLYSHPLEIKGKYVTVSKSAELLTPEGKSYRYNGIELVSTAIMHQLYCYYTPGAMKELGRSCCSG